MPQKDVDLASVFQGVTQALVENQQSLDQADEYNRDHGSNMVQTFQIITDALQKKKGSSDSAALRYAAKKLGQKSTSGSGKLYAQSLTQAADRFKGQKMNSNTILQLLQILIGGGQSGQSGSGDLISTLLGALVSGGTSAQQPSPSGGGDLMGALLSGLAGGGGMPAGQPSQSSGGDLMSALMGGLASGGGTPAQTPSQSGGDDLMGALFNSLSSQQPEQQAAHQPAPAGGGDLMGALLGGLTGSGSGGSGLEALAQAFLGGSGMGKSTHRTQSTQVVVDSFLRALSPPTNKP